MTTKKHETNQLYQSSTIIIGAILCYTNPLHHPTPGIQTWAMNNNRPINYRSEVDPKEDQRIRDNKDPEQQPNPDKKEEVNKPSKEDENIETPDKEERMPEDLPDTEDPNEAMDDIQED
ncbi:MULTISPECIES: hypothetical protein [Sphingobacterium]|uniref:Uncharacterized protein n=1 Tax=Sphingobacterium populi TaxID=1812824 RepID=A0ABW5U8T3_9SPHI|nr:hypothetical protein [Sphingobacterium sp. CFCC 11742]